MQKVHSPLQVGTVIRGRYEIEEVLGKRSFGTAYLVRDRFNSQKLFVLREAPKPGWKDRFRFSFDSSVFTDLYHPTLPYVYKVFTVDKLGRSFMLMDYIEGPNLETVRLAQPKQRFSSLQVMTSIVPVVEAVTYLHSQDHPIIHGEIKPSNIIVRKEGGAAVLVGFSLVKDAVIDTTFTFNRYRTHGYKAPEQFSGVTDPRTDIYALGAVLYTILTGIVPAGALYRVRCLVEKKLDPLSLMNQIAPDIPTGIASAIHRAMSIDRDYRYSTVEQFWYALWQGPIFNPKVQHTREQLIAPSAQRRELDANLTEEDATEPVDITPTEGNGEQDTDPPLRPIAESVVIAPAGKSRLDYYVGCQPTMTTGNRAGDRSNIPSFSKYSQFLHSYLHSMIVSELLSGSC